MSTKRPKGVSKRELASQSKVKTFKPTVRKQPTSRGGFDSAAAFRKGAASALAYNTKAGNAPNNNRMDTEGYTQKIYSGLPSNSAAKKSAASDAGDKARSISRNNSSNRAMASKAQSGLSGAEGITFGTGQKVDIDAALYSDGLRQRGGIGGQKQTGLGRLAQIANNPFGTGGSISEALKNKMGLSGVDISSALGIDDYLRIPSAQAENDPYNYAEKNIIELAGQGLGFPQTPKTSNPFDGNNNDGMDDGLSGASSSIFKKKNSSPTGDSSNDDSNRMDTESYTQDLYDNPPSYLDQATEQEDRSNQDQFPQDGSVQYPGGTQANRSGRGSGKFGNGALVSDGGNDPYIKEMRKSLQGFGSQEKSIRNQFEDLIKALDPTYDEYQRQGSDEINKQLLNNNTQLASVMNANNTGDSEQRAQLLAGQQRDSQTQLADLVRKLLLDKQEKVGGLQSKRTDAVNSVRSQKQQAQERLSKMMQDQANTQWDRDYKMAEFNKPAKGGGGKTYRDASKQIGVNNKGEPVYMDFNTGKQFTASGLKASYDPYEAAFESGRNSGGQQVQYDENGRPYIER